MTSNNQSRSVKKLTFGVIGLQLLRDLRKAAWLPKYDGNGVRKLVEEVNKHNQDMNDMLYQTDDSNGMPADVGCSVNTYDYVMERNKRILLAYHQYRMSALEALRWQVGPTLNKFHREKLDIREVEYFGEYNKVLNTYINDVGVDITACLRPPKQLKQEVFAKNDVHDIIQSETGESYNLPSNTRHFLNVADVENLIRSGDVEPIND